MPFTRWAAMLALCAGTASAQQKPDTLVLTRVDAIQLALDRNPQLDIARERIAQLRAVKVQAAAIPDPAVTASLDQQPGLFRSSASGQKLSLIHISEPTRQ